MKIDKSRAGRTLFVHLLMFALVLCPVLAEGRALQQTDTAVLSYTKGLELAQSGNYKDAIEQFKQAIKLKGDYAEAHFNLGDAYLVTDQYKKAIESYKQALKYRPEMALAYNNMGTAYYKSGQRKKAIEAYTAALKLNPKDALTYYNLGVVYAERGDKKAALEQYKVLLGLERQTADELYAIIYKLTATVFDVNGNGMVRLNATVTDAKGTPVVDAKQEDFRVLEDDEAQAIASFSTEEAPLIYNLLVDNSGSFRVVIEQAVAVANNIVRSQKPGDEGGVVRFIDNDSIETVQDFTASKTALLKAVDSLYIEGGQTALLDAVYVSAERVAQYKTTGGVYRRRALILLTDGEDRDSYYKLAEVIKLLRKLDVQIFAICLGEACKGRSDLDPKRRPEPVDMLTKLTGETGGQTFRPTSTTDLQNVAGQVMNTLRTQYVIGYKPTKAWRSGEQRKVTVSLVETPGGEKRRVITRSGYIIPEKIPDKQ